MIILFLLIFIIVIIYLIYTFDNFDYKVENKITKYSLNKVDFNLENILSDNDSPMEDIHTDDINNIISNNNKNVYLDISYQGNIARVIINLNFKNTPITCHNFYEFCLKKAYKNSIFHRVIKNFMIQGGDFINNNGTGCISIYGSKFKDENFNLKHEKGSISMANSGPNSNGCQFFITTTDTPWLDGKHVVFGKVVKGLDMIEFIENLQTDSNDKPINKIIINDCGVI